MRGCTCKRVWWSVCLTVGFGVCSGPAAAEVLHFDSARWRLEAQAVGGSYSGKVDRNGDTYFTGCVEYECPAYERSTFGLRLYPLLVYREDEDDHGEAHTIYGTALGITHRIYQHPDARDGVFFELGSAVLWHSREFEGNSARINFLSEVGVGYRFPESRWHGALKWAHVSNAGLSRSNAAVNGIVFAVGYSF